MLWGPIYTELSNKVSKCIYDIVYKAKPKLDEHVNLALLSSKLFLKVMDVIDEVIK